jgi:hypothetical protein
LRASGNAAGKADAQKKLVSESARDNGSSSGFAVPETTLDNLLEERNLAPRWFNAVIMDSPGNELAILKGASKTLAQVDMILAQLRFEETGQGCSQIGELDSLLSSYGFRRTYTWSSQRASGDALYLKTQLAAKPVEIPEVLVSSGKPAAVSPG